MKPLLPDVIVNGTLIAAERIAAEAQNHPAPREKPGQAWMAAARALALREMMLQEARTRGITPAPAEVAPGRIETEDEALIRQLLDQAIEPAPVDDAALRARYDANPDAFRAPTLYEAAHILIAAPPGDAVARRKASDTARAIRRDLSDAPGRFGELAQAHSACSSRMSGGLLGQIASGDTVPEFEAELDALRPGEIGAEPVETRYGFHVVRLDARARGAVLPFETVLPGLREAAQKVAWTRAAQAFTRELAARAEITGITLPVA